MPVAGTSVPPQAGPDAAASYVRASAGPAPAGGAVGGGAAGASTPTPPPPPSPLRGTPDGPSAVLLRNVAKIALKEVVTRRGLASPTTMPPVGRAINHSLQLVGAGLQAISLVVTTAAPGRTVPRQPAAAYRLTESWTVAFPQSPAAPAEGQVADFFTQLEAMLRQVKAVARGDLNKSFFIKLSLDEAERVASEEPHAANKNTTPHPPGFTAADPPVGFSASPHMMTLKCGDSLVLRAMINPKR